MNKVLQVLFMMMTCLSLAKAEVGLLSMSVDLQDKAKLQRGAKLFMNYCSGCHSLRYLRYNRMAQDLGLTTFTGEVDTELLVNNLVFTKAKIQDPIQVSLPETEALQWFGRVPPDLSLTARERGPNWIYTYLKSFYVDKKRPFGANNLLMPDVAMPNVLAPLVGTIVVKESTNDHFAKKLVLVKGGEMTQLQFDSAIIDLVTFLDYVAEPVKLVRYQLGVFVIIFLFVFLIFAYKLKKLYWKNVH